MDVLQIQQMMREYGLSEHLTFDLDDIEGVLNSQGLKVRKLELETYGSDQKYVLIYNYFNINGKFYRTSRLENLDGESLDTPDDIIDSIIEM